MTFIYSLQKSLIKLHQMKRKLLKHIVQFSWTLTIYNTKRSLLVAPLKKQTNVSLAMSLTVPKRTFKTVACTGDTDVLVLLISVLPFIQKIKSCKIICKLAIGDNWRYDNFSLLSKELRDNVGKALPFFHAFWVGTLILVSITTSNYSSLMHECRILKKKLNKNLPRIMQWTNSHQRKSNMCFRNVCYICVLSEKKLQKILTLKEWMLSLQNQIHCTKNEVFH